MIFAIIFIFALVFGIILTPLAYMSSHDWKMIGLLFVAICGICYTLDTQMCINMLSAGWNNITSLPWIGG